MGSNSILTVSDGILTVNVSAAAVGGDTLTGGSGSNSLVLTTSGTFSLGGVSKFGSIYLAAGNNTVTVTEQDAVEGRRGGDPRRPPAARPPSARRATRRPAKGSG